jgi:DNA-binding SARP family transcriptional activator
VKALQLLGLTERELELLLLIARNRKGIARREAIDEMWPSLDAASANDAFNTTLHRLRRRLHDDDAIERDGPRYFLGNITEVDLWELEERAKASLEPLYESQRADVAKLLSRVRTGDRARARWDWFESVESRLHDLARPIATALAEDSLRNGAPADALEINSYLSQRDALDKMSASIAVRAHLQLGNKRAALDAFRNYRRLLLAEYGTEPTAELQELMAGV